MKTKTILLGTAAWSCLLLSLSSLGQTSPSKFDYHRINVGISALPSAGLMLVPTHLEFRIAPRHAFRVAGQPDMEPAKPRNSPLNGLQANGFQIEGSYRLNLSSQLSDIHANRFYIGVGYYYRALDIQARVIERSNFQFDGPRFSGALSPLLNALFPPRVSSFDEQIIDLSGPMLVTGGFVEMGGNWRLADQIRFVGGVRFSDRTGRTTLNRYWAARLPKYLQDGLSVNFLLGLEVEFWKTSRN